MRHEPTERLLQAVIQRRTDVRSVAEIGRKLDVSPDTMTRIRRDGADQRTRLALLALAHCLDLDRL